MEDGEILNLYGERSEHAIQETDKKYGKLCRKICTDMMSDLRDCEEIVSDTWLTLWKTIPPKKPDSFKMYICRVAKNLCLKKLEYNSAKKRKSNYEVVLDELAECVTAKETVEDQVMEKELADSINRFLETLPAENRQMFMRRYWFLDSVKDIAGDNHITEQNAAMRLARIRRKLKDYLIEEGYEE